MFDRKFFLKLVQILTIATVVISCKNNQTLFENLPSSKTNITFQNNLPNQKGFNILYYLYYYEGGGVATGDLNNDGLPDIFATGLGGNRLFQNKGGGKFLNVTEAAGVGGASHPAARTPPCQP